MTRWMYFGLFWQVVHGVNMGFGISYRPLNGVHTTKIIHFIYYTTPACATKHSHPHTHIHIRVDIYYFKWLPKNTFVRFLNTKITHAYTMTWIRPAPARMCIESPSISAVHIIVYRSALLYYLWGWHKSSYLTKYAFIPR